MSIAQNIKKIRALAGLQEGRIKKDGRPWSLTLGEFAKLIGSKGSTVSSWEAGRHEPDDDALNKIAYIFHVDRDQLENGEITALGPLAMQRKWPPHKVSATMGVQFEATHGVSGAAPLQIDAVQNSRQVENIEAVTGLFALLEHESPQIRQHIISQIQLLTRAQFPQAGEYKDIVLRRAESIKQIKEMLTKEAVKTLLEDNIIPLFFADSLPHEKKEDEDEDEG